jgi:hypothetical protein
VAGMVALQRAAPDREAAPVLAAASQPLAVAGGADLDRRIDSYFGAHRQQSIRRAALSEGAALRPFDAAGSR